MAPEDVELALTLPFDSIMIDASALEEADNIAFCANTVKKAQAVGISIEVEMGRIEGGEDGLPQVDIGTVLTDPLEAASFMTKTGAHFLAPSFGNIHGGYGKGGPEASWNIDLQVSLTIYGTYTDFLQTD
ncbi:hypothetical protein H2198_010226 [Neophaeococcomyces mojaviensis]|uniref:Uncharacterized protein n=1 Tax=Neophaeococcomyces mojaviensis TaxID=3383035 RepID=A0ACC2ZS74_9EURO|nr:hypothetical protein H2198_010226 [Knufia sp. JES_112]